MKKGKKVIVFCDDSLTARMVVKDELEAQGFIVYEASKPSELEKMLSENEEIRSSIDLIILDLSMPEMTGTQVGSSFPVVFKELEKVPFIIYSGEPQETVKASLKEAYEFFGEIFYKNFAGYIEKGEDSIKPLLSKVKEVMEKRQAKK